jgi:hypothetical protein
MPLDKITVDSIASNAVTNIGIANGTIVSVDLADQSVISSKLASNLNISLTRVLEEANINSIAIGGNVNIDVTDSTVFFFNANTTANVTFNVRANTQNTFDSITAIGETTSLAIAVKHGDVRHEANLSIDGVVQTIYYAANTRPANVSISSAEINLFSYSIFKTAANVYTVISANTIFGLG